MCEFCTKHAEGKKWYLEAKNYARELLREPLSPEQRATVRANTRAEWLHRFEDGFVAPAGTAVPKPIEALLNAVMATPELPGSTASPDEVLEGRKTTHFGQVIPIEDAEKVIDLVDSITRIPCGCRFLTIGKADKRYCFALFKGWQPLPEQFPFPSSSLEVLTKEEAKRIIREYDTEGLIHTVWTGVTPFVMGLCNCDRDCLAYRSSFMDRGIAMFFRGEYVAKVDPELCSGCKDCLKQCQFGAEFYSSGLGQVYIDPTRCFGCGLCRAACPTDAIHLLARQDEPAAAERWLSS